MQLPSTKEIKGKASAVATNIEANGLVRSMTQTGCQALQVSDAADSLEENGNKTKRRDGFILKLERSLSQGSSGFAQHKHRSGRMKAWNTMKRVTGRHTYV